MNRLIVQLVINGQAVWQTFADDIPDRDCRRMTDAELREVGKAAASALSGIVEGTAVHIVIPTSVHAAPAAAPAGKKRRP